MKPSIETIHESLVNGSRQQMAEQINEYGLYDFFADYKQYLFEVYANESSRYAYFTDAVISYHHISNQ